MQLTVPFGETVVFFKDWNLVLILSPFGMLLAGIVIVALLRGALGLYAEKRRLITAINDLYGLISERNAEINRLTHALEDGRP